MTDIDDHMFRVLMGLGVIAVLVMWAILWEAGVSLGAPPLVAIAAPPAAVATIYLLGYGVEMIDRRRHPAAYETFEDSHEEMTVKLGEAFKKGSDEDLDGDHDD